jgi:hypothetical protein
MTLKEILIQELETASDEVLSETINFVQFLKTKPSESQAVTHLLNTNTDEQTPPEKKCTVGDLLQFAGEWQGDDGQECLEMVYATRSRSSYDPTKNPFK